jgi:hypothetical protein
MRMSLRIKMAVILLVATGIPFVIGGAAVQLVVGPAYRSAVAQASREHSGRIADQIAGRITQDASRLEKLGAWADLRQLARHKLRRDEQAAHLDRLWPTLPVSADQLRPLIHNPVARELRWWRDTDASVVEIIATDDQGQLIAATGKPGRVNHADQYWWRQAFDKGRGRVFVSDVAPQPGGAPTLQIAVPIYEDGTPNSRAIGAMRMVLDAKQFFASVVRPGTAQKTQTLVVDLSGQVVHRAATSRTIAPNPTFDQLRQVRSSALGSSVFNSPGASVFTSWARVAVNPRPNAGRYRIPTLYIVTQRNAADAFATLANVQLWMLLIALVTTVLAVWLGSWLADVLVVRQVRTLARGMRELARGDFEGAAQTASRLIGEAPPTPKQGRTRGAA